MTHAHESWPRGRSKDRISAGFASFMIWGQAKGRSDMRRGAHTQHGSAREAECLLSWLPCSVSVHRHRRTRQQHMQCSKPRFQPEPGLWDTHAHSSACSATFACMCC
jgi:hypothetical protein